MLNNLPCARRWTHGKVQKHTTYVLVCRVPRVGTRQTKRHNCCVMGCNICRVPESGHTTNTAHLPCACVCRASEFTTHSEEPFCRVPAMCRELISGHTANMANTIFVVCVRGLAHGKHEALGIQAVSCSDYSFIKSKAAIVEVHL